MDGLINPGWAGVLVHPECVVGRVWVLMVLYDMCVLMSATAPNSCKLAVYEAEVL